MRLNQINSILLDEIATEGLEGITLECLWEYLKASQYFKSIDKEYKEFLWTLIQNFSEVNFYQLSEPRECNFKFKHRTDQYNYKEDVFIEDNICMVQSYKLNIIEDSEVFGSCVTYRSRTLIDDDIKNNINCSYENVMNKFGNTLIIVASEKIRFKILGVRQPISLSKASYALLELIARSRRNGIKAIGANSCLEFVNDAQLFWFLKTKLKSQDLIRIQKMNFLQSGGTIKQMSVFQINRYYRPYYNIVEQNTRNLFHCMREIHSCGILKVMATEVLKLPEAFLLCAKQLGWLEVIITTYRKLNKSCDLDICYTDKELLDFYISDFRLPLNSVHPLSLLDKRSSFIKPIKSLDELNDVMTGQFLFYENDEEPTPDVSLANNFVGINLDEPLHIQILKLLAQIPMNVQEIKARFGLKKAEGRALMNSLIRKNEVVVHYEMVDKNAVPFYTIRQTLTQPIPFIEMSIKKQMEIQDSKENNQLTVLKFENPHELTAAMRNPRRQERYDYLIGLVKSHEIVTGHSAAQKYIRSWEQKRGLKSVMDRKSYRRIVDDAVRNHEIKLINVDYRVLEKRISEVWLTQPEMTRENEIFKEKLEHHIDICESKNKHVKLFVETVKRKKKKKVKRTDINCSTGVKILKIVKNVNFDRKFIDFQFPDLPLMIKRKILHEFIWYISIGCHLEPNLNTESKIDEHGFQIYFESFDWKRFVAPLDPDDEDKLTDFNLNDLLLRMPLILFCLLVVPKKCNEDLFNLLMDENLRWATLDNLTVHHIPTISFLIAINKRRSLIKFIGLLESLMNMGLITKRQPKHPIRMKEEATYFLNREVFITDTSKYKLPISDDIIWMRLPRYQWVMTSQLDLINFWENVYKVCTSTPCDMAYRPHGLQILANDYYESIRNNDYISKNVVSNGPVSLENAENMKQFGVWLPLNTMKWNDLGPGGYYRSISSSCIVSWCPNKFDKVCSSLSSSLAESCNQFRLTLFSETMKNSNSSNNIDSLNESLSLILNEINIVVTAAELLRYTDIKFFWNKIRPKKWFKGTFVNIRYQTWHAIEGYISLLSNDHENEKKDLISTAMNYTPMKNFSKIEDIELFREQHIVKEAAVTRFILLKLIEMHRFIPQWDPMAISQFPQNNVFQPDVSMGVDETEIKVVDVFKITSNLDPNRKVILPDVTSTVSDIMTLQLVKYLTGCMHSYKDFTEANKEFRNQILTKYSADMILSTINGFKNFYITEPMKQKKNVQDLVKSETFDHRLAKLSYKLSNKNQSESSQDICIRNYLEWANPPRATDSVENSTRSHDSMIHRHLFRYNLDNCTKGDVLSLMGLMYTLGNDSSASSMNLEVNHNYFKFDDDEYNTKSVSQSRVYKINMKRKNIGLINWDEITKNATITVQLSDVTYQSLFNPEPLNDIWENASQFVTLRTSEPPTKRARTRSDNMVSETVIDTIEEFIEDGQYAGRNNLELKKKFPESPFLYDHLQALLKTQRIWLVGMNTFHYVADKYIKPWLIRLPAMKPDTFATLETRRKRTKSSSADESAQYFLPEFYRGEIGEFKCITFAEIANRIFTTAYKNAGCTLHFLISELSLYLGEVMVLKIVEIMRKYNVLKLITYKASGRRGLFQKQVTYEIIEYSPLEDTRSTTVLVHPLCHFRMSHLIRDISEFFSVNLVEYLTSEKKE